MSIEEKKGQSFAERFGKKENTFKSEKLKREEMVSKKDDSSNSFVDSISATQNSDKQPVNLQKKMQADLVYLVKGIDAGRNAWYYVLVDRPKVQLFLKALNDDIIHLDQYGKILYSAYGDEPPSEITNKLKEEYGIQG